MYLFMITFDLGVYGFIYARIINEIINFGLYIAVYYKKSDERVVGFEKPPMDLKAIGEYFLTCLKFTATNYAESIGFEVNTVYVGLLSNTEALAAYVLWVNVVEIIFFMGIGISNVLRTRINIFFGMKRASTAKNFFWWFIKCNIIMGMMMGLSISVFRYYVAHLYSDNEGITFLLGEMLLVFGIVAFMDFNVACIMTVYRSLGIVKYLVIIDLFV